MHCKCIACWAYYHLEAINRLCENEFCLYWSGQGCTLDSITLDIQGHCQACILVNIDSALLQKERVRMQKRLEETYASWGEA